MKSKKWGSVLVDCLIGKNTFRRYGQGKYFAKPYYSVGLVHRIIGAIQIITGKAYAIHFKEDEDEKPPKV